MAKEKRKLIGIPGFLNSDKMFGVTGNYMQFASQFGDVRIIMPHEDLVEVDLLILPGGLDVSPSSYNQVPSYQTTNHDVFKEYFFKNKLAAYVDSKTPIFGICLGFQMLNVHFGGTLTQHLPFHPTSDKRWEVAHEIILTNSKDQKKIKVNSHHHQGIAKIYNKGGDLIYNDLAEGFKCIAHYDEKPRMVLVECFKHETLPIAGVQYHPEELLDSLSELLINQLLESK